MTVGDGYDTFMPEYLECSEPWGEGTLSSGMFWLFCTICCAA
jgi:hypothetical protein